jgi:hypothetical protein
MFTGPIFSKPLTKAEEMEMAAMEATSTNSITHRMPEQYTLRDKYFPYIESFLPKTEHLLFRHIAKYEDKYGYILNSPYPLKNLPFGENEKGEDYDIVYRCTNINRDELRADMKKVPLPGNLTKEKAAFLPFQLTLYLIIRYYTITNQLDKAKIIYGYYGYSIYWKRFHTSFKLFPPVETVMVYTINEMSYRNLIKKLGSVKALLVYIVQHIFEYYREGLVQSCDEDMRYILDQVQSDIGSKMNNIATMYYKNYNEKKEIYMGETLIKGGEGEQREDTSITATAAKYAQIYTTKFFADPINVPRIKTAVALATEASAKEVEHTLDYILNNASNSEVYEFYSSIFFYYLSLDDPKITEESIKSLKFVAIMRNVIKKGNSIDKNINKIIAFTDKYLELGSNTFRLTQRDGTRTNYRKAVYNYFILSVTN